MYKEENSYKTSRKVIARTYKKYSDFLEKSANVLDYGSGRYHEKLIKYAEANNIKLTLYDKFNPAISEKPQGTFEIVVCNNVLNVIKCDKMLSEVIRDCISYAERTVIFRIYEGDRKGLGNVTSNGTFQRNLKYRDYKEFFEGLDYRVIFRGGYIIVRKKEMI